jgi:hypothetical protein
MVVVGDLDPYWKSKQLQNLSNSIANAISYANEAKEKKRSRIRSEFQQALELGQADPEAGLIAMNELESRYKDKLLEKAIPERSAYRGLMAKQIEEGEPMRDAWKSFERSVLEKEKDLQEMQSELDQTPQVTGLDPSTTSPQAYMEAMMQFAQGNPMAMQQTNPEYERKAKILQKMSDPDYMMQAAYGEIRDPTMRINLQRYFTEEELGMNKVLGLVDRSKLPGKVRAGRALDLDALSPMEREAAMAEIGQTVTPADQMKHNWQLDRVAFSGEQARETGRQRDEAREALERQRQKGRLEMEEERRRTKQTVTGDAALKAKGKGADEDPESIPDDWDSMFGDRKEFSKGKWPASTDTQSELRAMSAELSTLSGGKISEGQAGAKLLDMFIEDYNASDFTDEDKDLRVEDAMKRIRQMFKGEQPIEQPEITAPRGSGGR